MIPTLSCATTLGDGIICGVQYEGKNNLDEQLLRMKGRCCGVTAATGFGLLCGNPSGIAIWYGYIWTILYCD